jgi:hypothetical protein
MVAVQIEHTNASLPDCLIARLPGGRRGGTWAKFMTVKNRYVARESGKSYTTPKAWLCR